MFKVSIPEISDDQLKKRYAQIRPIVSDEQGNKFWLKEFQFDELKTIAYNWDHERRGEPVNAHELCPLLNEDFACIIKYGYYGLFKPTIAEILAQIDTPCIKIVRAFEIIERPILAEDFYKTSLHTAIFNASYHVATVRLYTYANDSHTYKLDIETDDEGRFIVWHLPAALGRPSSSGAVR